MMAVVIKPVEIPLNGFAVIEFKIFLMRFPAAFLNTLTHDFHSV